MPGHDRTPLPPDDAKPAQERARDELDRQLDELADISDEAGLYDDAIVRTRLRR